MRMIVALLLLLLALASAAPLPVVDCPCDHDDPKTLDARVCGLCAAARNQPEEVFFLKDINPNKPNRYLALPRAHGDSLQAVGEMPAQARARLWSGAIEKAVELFGPRWGLAHNGHLFRTQCHAHIHMGPLSADVDDVNGTLYDSPAEFPAVDASRGMWLHPKDGRYCVHLDRDLAEVVLIR